MRPIACAVLSAALLLAARPAAAAPEWVGDFETGDLSQWTLSNTVIGNIDNIGVTQEQVYEGIWAGRIELHPTDIAPGGLTRNELVFFPGPEGFEDAERYYSMSLRRELDDAWGDSWHILWFFEGNPVFANAVSINAIGTNFQFRTFIGAETQHWQGPFTPGEWHNFVLHVRWSPDASTGFVELYYNDEVVVPVTSVATMHGPGVPNEMHVGIIRDPNITAEEVLYIDNAKMGATLEDVQPGEPPPPTTGGSGGDTGDDTADTSDGDASDDVGTEGDSDEAPGDGNDEAGPGDASDGPAGNDDRGGTGGGGGSTGESAAGQEGGGSCACRSTPGPRGSAGMFALALLALRRRRSTAAVDRQAHT